MKILHTADWHIGKSLYKHDLYEDILLFFEELIQIIQEESIDVLLISGDIFDLANPSNHDKEIYYRFLTQLTALNIRTIITAGNHDSVRMLEAPKQLLSFLHIDVVGDASIIENQIFPLKDKNDAELACILAIPYLRDRDIRQVSAGEKYKDKITATREGIANHYKKVKACAQKMGFKGPFIAMGHLYMQGASISESEREIQIGNTAGISVEQFADLFDYMALGHIHSPQKLNKAGSIRYSGSPISLSFSERSDEKTIVVVNLSYKEPEIKAIKLKKNRDLIRLIGTVDELKTELAAIRNKKTLIPFIEVHAMEAEKDNVKILELINLAQQESEEYKIVHHKIQFEKHQNKLIAQEQNLTIEEMKPIDVFRSKMNDEIQDDKLKKDLEIKFHELVDELNQS